MIFAIALLVNDFIIMCLRSGAPSCYLLIHRCWPVTSFAKVKRTETNKGYTKKKMGSHSLSHPSQSRGSTD